MPPSTILVSSALLALVVNANPIQRRQDAPQLDASAALQDVVQAIFHSSARQSLECLSCEKEEDIHAQTVEEQAAVLSALDDLDAVKAVAPIALDGVLTDDEKKLYDLLASPRPYAKLDDLEGHTAELQDVDAAAEELDLSADTSEPTNDEALFVNLQQYMPESQVLVLTFSCIAALLAMGCIGVGLYALHYFRKKAGLELSWELMPRVEARDAVEIVVDDDFASRLYDQKHRMSTSDVSQHRPDITPLDFGSPIRSPQSRRATPAVLSLDSDDESDAEESDEEDLDEKFHDAEEVPFYSWNVASSEKVADVPVILIEDHADPDYMPLPLPWSAPTFRPPTPYSTPPPTPPRTPHRRMVEMREANASISRPASPVSKPAWSVRASDAPALGFSSTEARAAPVPLPLPIRPARAAPSSPSPAQPPTSTSALPIPGGMPLQDTDVQMVELPKTRRAYRSPVPELDIAFALQLRPGLGLGSDPAWIVRFMMAMFGWMTVLFGSGGAVVMRGDRRAIA
ncbi:hypothetical protein EIP91_006309 [Steccherinum ochraceum]|uniref:Uncharacterized protein n=1 Tax=Steccherinum ochraceum TaxID=92696 RepID=A0A4R0RRB4_9APHY|nr:hypothetical protein EIP91_006309 [Steccherinum ochraceum]